MCNDRRWFKSYEPFKSRTEFPKSPELGDGYSILGIGTVVLDTRKSAVRNGPVEHGQIVLEYVLHAPDAPYNFLAIPIATKEFKVLKEEGTNKRKCKATLVRADTREQVAYFEPDKPSVNDCWRLKLGSWPTGLPTGPSTLSMNVGDLPTIIWPSSEKSRWLAHKQAIEALDSNSTIAQFDRKPYTNKETRWLQENFDDEKKFLRKYGLNINREEDRDEGRWISRALMKIAWKLPTAEEDDVAYLLEEMRKIMLKKRGGTTEIETRELDLRNMLIMGVVFITVAIIANRIFRRG